MTAPSVLVSNVTGVGSANSPPSGRMTGCAAVRAAGEGGSKKTPLTTALCPPFLVTRMAICPVRFHDRYLPPWKSEMLWLLIILPVLASSTSIVAAGRVSQSTQ